MICEFVFPSQQEETINALLFRTFPRLVKILYPKLAHYYKTYQVLVFTDLFANLSLFLCQNLKCIPQPPNNRRLALQKQQREEAAAAAAKGVLRKIEDILNPSVPISMRRIP